MRVALGNGLLRVGLFIRKVSMGFAALCTVAIIVVVISAVFGVDDFPTIFGDPGERVGAWTYVWQAAIVNVALIVVGRFILGGLFVLAGWRLLPQAHRDFLTEL